MAIPFRGFRGHSWGILFNWKQQTLDIWTHSLMYYFKYVNSLLMYYSRHLNSLFDVLLYTFYKSKSWLDSNFIGTILVVVY